MVVSYGGAGAAITAPSPDFPQFAGSTLVEQTPALGGIAVVSLSHFKPSPIRYLLS